MALNDYYNETITFIKDECITKQQVMQLLEQIEIKEIMLQ